MESKLTIICAIIAAFACYGTCNAESLWTRNLAFEKGIKLNWIHSDPEYVTIEMSAPAKGYVAVGISPNGSMTGADMIMGWVDSDGKAYIKDTYGVGNTKPKEDKVSNVELIKGTENESGTTIQFRRKWVTTDAEQDIAIKNETMIVIWAYNQVDPALKDKDGLFKPPYHFENRGSKRHNLMI